MKKFILYDGRAKSGDEEDASILIIASSEKEARKDARDYEDYDAIWYEYDVKRGGDGKDYLDNGRPRWDLPPANAK